MSKTIERKLNFLQDGSPLIEAEVTTRAIISGTGDTVVEWEIKPQNSTPHKQRFSSKKDAANFLTKIFDQPHFSGVSWEVRLTNELNILLEEEQFRLNKIEHPTKLKNFTKDLEELLNKYGARFEIQNNYDYKTLEVNFQDGLANEDMLYDIALEIPSTL